MVRKEELLPLHVAAVAARERREMSHHEGAELAAIAQSQILPKVVWALGAPRNHARQQIFRAANPSSRPA